MIDQDDPNAPSGLDSHREELASEFLRVAQTEPSSRFGSLRWRKWIASLAALALAATTGLAIAGELPPGEEASPELVPVSEHPSMFSGADARFPDCPVEVRKSIFELDDVADYVGTPGYPVAGCPSVEALANDDRIRTTLERLKADPSLREAMLENLDAESR